MIWSRFVCLGTLLTLATLGASAESSKRVLMAFREARHVPATVMMEQAVWDRLPDPGTDGIGIYTEYLDANRFADGAHRRLFRESLSPFHPRRR